MRFEFTAVVDQLDYETEVNVEKQALAHLAVPDMTILMLEIGTWRKQLKLTASAPQRWEADVAAVVSDGRRLGEHDTQAAIWPHGPGEGR